MNKKFYLIVFFLLMTGLGYGQKIKKVIKFYQTGDYQKCIEAAKKEMKKNPKMADLYYYSGLSYFNLFKNSPQLKKKYYMQNAVNKTYAGLRRDTLRAVFAEFEGDYKLMHDSLKKFALNLFYNDKKSESEFFFKYLAIIFKDTTDEYMQILAEQNPQKIIVQQLAFNEYNGPVNQKDAQGRKQGVWIEKYDNGVVKSEIYYVDGHPGGVFRLYYPNGKLKADLYFDKSSRRASAILYKQDGSKFAMGYYLDKKKDSLWQYFHNDTTVILEENYKKGVKDGPEYVYSIFYYPNLLEEKYWKNGKLDSIYVRYFPWGSPQFMTFYKNGRRNGPTNVFDENRRLITKGYYKNDLPDSTWQYWDAEKKQYITVIYKDGKLISKDYEQRESEIIEEQMQNVLEDPRKQFYEQNTMEDNN